MTLNNPQKLIGAMVIVLCITFLIATSKISSESGVPVITLIAGYIVGNGVGAKSNTPIEPIIGPSKKDKENS